MWSMTTNPSEGRWRGFYGRRTSMQKRSRLPMSSRKARSKRQTPASSLIFECLVQAVSIFSRSWQPVISKYRSSWFPPVTTQKFVNAPGNWGLFLSSENLWMTRPFWMPSRGLSPEQREITKSNWEGFIFDRRRNVEKAGGCSNEYRG